MEKITLKSIVEWGKRAKNEKSINGESKLYFQLMLTYHNDYSIYYDNRVGDFTNNDDEYTRKFEYHEKQMDKFFNELKKLEKIENAKSMESLESIEKQQLNQSFDDEFQFLCGFCGQMVECDKTTIIPDCDRHKPHQSYMITHTSCTICGLCVDNNKIDGDKTKFICDECFKKIENELYVSVEITDNNIIELLGGDINFDCLAHFDIMVDLELNVVTFPKHLDLSRCIGIVENAIDMNYEKFENGVDEFECDDDTQKYYDLFFDYNFVGDYIDYNGSMVIAILEFLIQQSNIHIIPFATIAELSGGDFDIDDIRNILNSTYRIFNYFNIDYNMYNNIYHSKSKMDMLNNLVELSIALMNHDNEFADGVNHNLYSIIHDVEMVEIEHNREFDGDIIENIFKFIILAMKS